MAFATFVTGEWSLGMNGRKNHRKWPRIALFFGSKSSSRSLASKSSCLEESVRAMFCDRKIGGEGIFPVATKFHRQILVSPKKKSAIYFWKWKFENSCQFFYQENTWHIAHRHPALFLLTGAVEVGSKASPLATKKKIFFHWLFTDRILITDYHPHITGYNPLSPLNNQGLFHSSHEDVFVLYTIFVYICDVLLWHVFWDMWNWNMLKPTNHCMLFQPTIIKHV